MLYDKSKKAQRSLIWFRNDSNSHEQGTILEYIMILIVIDCNSESSCIIVYTVG
jgi:hypothetical protein